MRVRTHSGEVKTKGFSRPVPSAGVDLEERQQIGRRVADARRAAGLTQRELADALGVTTRSVQHYESGTVVPFKHMRRLERVTMTRPGWILGDTDSPELQDSLDGLQAAIRRHQSLMADHLEEMRRHTERLRALRQTSEQRRTRDQTSSG